MAQQSVHYYYYQDWALNERRASCGVLTLSSVPRRLLSQTASGSYGEERHDSAGSDDEDNDNMEICVVEPDDTSTRAHNPVTSDDHVSSVGALQRHASHHDNGTISITISLCVYFCPCLKL